MVVQLYHTHSQNSLQNVAQTVHGKSPWWHLKYTNELYKLKQKVRLVSSELCDMFQEFTPNYFKLGRCRFVWIVELQNWHTDTNSDRADNVMIGKTFHGSEIILHCPWFDSNDEIDTLHLNGYLKQGKEILQSSVLHLHTKTWCSVHCSQTERREGLNKQRLKKS